MYYVWFDNGRKSFPKKQYDSDFGLFNAVENFAESFSIPVKEQKYINWECVEEN